MFNLFSILWPLSINQRFPYNHLRFTNPQAGNPVFQPYKPAHRGYIQIIRMSVFCVRLPKQKIVFGRLPQQVGLQVKVTTLSKSEYAK